MDFKLVSDYEPKGDQPEAINSLVRSIERKQGSNPPRRNRFGENLHHGERHSTPPATGPYHFAQQDARGPTVFRIQGIFPKNAVEYFVSYYDYYQPEAYVPSTDTFIEKDSSINEEIERLRLAATGSLISRNDVIVIASVSCIYGLGSRMTSGLFPWRSQREMRLDETPSWRN